MNNASSTTITLAVPMLIVALAVVGPFKKRAPFVALWIFLFIGVSAFLLAAGFSSQMAAGHGSSESGGWDGWGPLPLWVGLALSLLIFGIAVRPRNQGDQDLGSTPEKSFPSLRELTEQKNAAEQDGESGS